MLSTLPLRWSSAGEHFLYLPLPLRGRKRWWRSIVLLLRGATREEMHNHYATGDGLLNHILLIILESCYCSRGQYLEEAEITGVRSEADWHFFRSNLCTNLMHQLQAWHKYKFMDYLPQFGRLTAVSCIPHNLTKPLVLELKLELYGSQRRITVKIGRFLSIWGRGFTYSQGFWKEPTKMYVLLAKVYMHCKLSWGCCWLKKNTRSEANFMFNSFEIA